MGRRIAGEYFPEPRVQLENVYRWADEIGWVWSPRQRRAAEALVPQLPRATLRPLRAPILVPWLDNLASTARMLWNAAAQDRVSSYNWFGIRYGDQFGHISEWTQGRIPPRNSLQWVVLALDAGRGKTLDEARTGQRMPAGLELLAAAAHAPQWASQLGYEFPSVLLADCAWIVPSWGVNIPRLWCQPHPGRLDLDGVNERDIEGDLVKALAKPSLEVVGA